MKASEGQSTAGSPKNSARIDYLDGIRGLAALAVIFVHVFEAFGLDQEWAGIISNGRLTATGIDRFIPILNNLTRYGAYAVQIFLVISGYSLMLAIAKSKDGKPKGGLKGYFVRRIRRIWPPYYAALFIGLFLIAVVPGMNVKQNIWWDQALPAFKPDVILSHMLFLHHFSPDWLQKINPAMWTIAIEETIYLLFPFTLLPVWRRFGTIPMVLTGIIVGAASWYLFHPLLQVANPWFLGLFALGAMGASFGFSNRSQEHRWRERIPWIPVSIVSFLLFIGSDVASKQVFVSRLGFDIKGSAPWLVDAFLGIAVVALLIHLTEQWKTKEEKGLLRILHLPPILKLGTFSYSLYLIHPPILTLVTLTAIRLNLTSWPVYVFEVVVGVPVCIIGAYLFHLVFERPFMPTYLAKAEPEVLTTTKVASHGWMGHEQKSEPAKIDQGVAMATPMSTSVPVNSDNIGQD
ncbi:MAG: acyltransferase [Anaerolineae bacterium]|nr:acyltransferase [Anaerolineae bacterium]